MKFSIFVALGAAALSLSACATAETKMDATPHEEMAAKKHHEPHLVKTVSDQDFNATLASLQGAIDKRGFKTFAVIDHAKGAASIDQPLRPTTLMIFGNPKGGTPLMQSAQTLGIALPLRALVYLNGDGEVIIATTDIAHTLHEHGVADREDLMARIKGALAAIAEEAAKGAGG